MILGFGIGLLRFIDKPAFRSNLILVEYLAKILISSKLIQQLHCPPLLQTAEQTFYSQVLDGIQLKDGFPVISNLAFTTRITIKYSMEKIVL